MLAQQHDELGRDRDPAYRIPRAALRLTHLVHLAVVGPFPASRRAHLAELQTPPTLGGQLALIKAAPRAVLKVSPDRARLVFSPPRRGGENVSLVSTLRRHADISCHRSEAGAGRPPSDGYPTVTPSPLTLGRPC